MAEPEYRFDEHELAAFDESLRPLDSVLQSLATRYRLQLSRTASKGWPGRTLKRRRGFKTYFLRISLEPSYTETSQLRWEIHDLWMYDYGEVFRKLVTFHTLEAALDSNMIQNGVAADVVQQALERNFAGT